jgi:hypothetical protein
MVAETRATQPSGRNVLEDLDSRIPTSFYWYLAVLACVGGFLFGYDTSNIGSALTKGLSVEQAVHVFEKEAEASKAPM